MPPKDINHLLIHKTCCDSMLTQLETIEHAGNDYFQRLQQALSTPYPLGQAQEDLAKLQDLISKFYDLVGQSGHLGTQATTPTFKSMADCGRWNEERNKRVTKMAEELKDITENVAAAMPIE
ncbi:hypothetical protein IWQ60_001686 [Tieghemiomyces parasiticus]|uniref:Uncharacterized protein n=1 Tax=Tieghemiomyces parasiticus TaxID=78921 RepID=A0A9W8E2A9_9FUNG|nr:hypothetical protein IWQ60_001686 [Tieghemiomyces parasiticus]